jgi:DNA-binding CsgD family transcriptional regulator
MGCFLQKSIVFCGAVPFFDKFLSEENIMKKLFASVPILLFLILILSGCSAVGEKSASLTIIYGATAVLSLLLLIGCLLLVRKNKAWFILLFSSVLVVNIGYTFLAMSTCLEMALWANRVAYLGSVFLPLAMLMIILDVSGTKHPKWLHGALGALSFLVFLIAASPGILPIYYKEVSFAVVNGVSTLVKVYGPLHPLYLVYLLGYFAAMVTVIIRAKIKKTIDTTANAAIPAIAVFVNIGVWFIEQLVVIDFEMLSVSYIISELFLLGVHLVMNEYRRLKMIVKQVESVQNYSEAETSTPNVMLEKPVESESIAPERIEFFMMGLQTLTPAERAIYDAYVARVTTKEIMANMDIKESTLKYHNRNLYGKLGVSSRKELLEVHKQIKSVQTVLGGANHDAGK